jgi:hypothetical protein
LGEETRQPTPYQGAIRPGRVAVQHLHTSSFLFILKPHWKFFSVFGGLVIINRKFASAKKKEKKGGGVSEFLAGQKLIII